MSDFQSFPKMSRFFRDIIVTEKIDGTNAQVYIHKFSDLSLSEGLEDAAKVGTTLLYVFETDDGVFGMYAGSRNRLLSLKNDNYGFARWVSDNAAELSKLGEGRHFGEWWGAGINRGYGLTGPNNKFFSLFNTTRWADSADRPACALTVPVLYSGPILNQAGELAINDVLRRLRFAGSQVALGYRNAEGIVVFHTHGNFLQKISLDPVEDAGGKGV